MVRPRVASWAPLACAAWVLVVRTVAADDTPASAELHAPFGQAPVAGTVAFDDRGLWWGIHGTLPLGLAKPGPPAPFDRARAFGLGLSIAGDDRAGMSALRYTGLLDRHGPRTGEWLGISGGQGGSAGTQLHLGAGLWRAFKRIQVEAGVMTSAVPARQLQADHWGFYRQWGIDTMLWVDTTTYRAVSRTVRNTTAQGAMRWQLGRVLVSGLGGVVLRDMGAPARWAQATVDVRVASSILVTAAFGQRPDPSLAFDASAGARTMLAVRVTPWATRKAATASAVVPNVRAWSARPLPEGRTAVRVRCEGATCVELTGDFTDWEPVTLTALGGGWWGSELTIAPGLHQVQVRIDGGAWQAPPELPVTQGDFAGKAGLLLVE